jgi:hypothetical protein
MERSYLLLNHGIRHQEVKFSEEDLYQLLHKDCIAFVGDSLQRRAGDTLHALIEHQTNTSQIDR